MTIGDPENFKKNSAPLVAPKGEELTNDEQDGPLTAHGDEDEVPMRKVDQDWDDSDEGDLPEEEEGEAAEPALKRDARPVSKEGGARAPSSASTSGGAPQTGSRASSSRAGSQTMDEEEDEAPQRPAPRGRMERRAPPNSVQELFANEIPQRASFADPKLRQHLTGTVLVKVQSFPDRRGGSDRGGADRGYERGGDRRGSEQRFLFDWTAEAARCAPSEATTADCVISVSETNLMRIAQGDLNPQISMLSDKVRIEGQASFAIYFFNLVAPQNGSFV
jgi:hypothetical protein